MASVRVASAAPVSGDDGGLALGPGPCRLGAGLLDVDRHVGLGQLRLHVGDAALLLEADAGLLGLALLGERGPLLGGDLAAGQHLDEVGREDDVLDVDAAGLDLVAGQVLLDVAPRRRAAPRRASR